MIPNDSHSGFEEPVNAASEAAEPHPPEVCAVAARYAPVPVWLFGRISLRSVGVYAGLRSFAFGNDSCSPTEADAARRLHISVDTVARARRELIDVKAVEVVAGERAVGGRYVYEFLPRPANARDGWAKVPLVLLGLVCPAAVGLYGAARSFQGSAGTFPTVDTIAKRAGVSHTQTKQYLRELRLVGAIEVVGRTDSGGRTTSNAYHFPVRFGPRTPEGEQVSVSTGLTAEGAGGRPQIPPGVDRESRPQTKPINKTLDPDLVGWSAPMARVAFEGNTTGAFEELEQGVAPPQSPSELPQTPGALLRDNSPVPLAASTRTSGWHRRPLADENLERRSSELVALFARGQTDLGRNSPNPTTRENWLRSARVMLAGPDIRNYDQARELVVNVCRDQFWSGRIRSLFDLKENWDQVARDFSERAPKDIGVAKAVRQRAQAVEQTNEPHSQQTEQSGTSGSEVIGVRKLSTLVEE